MSFATPEPARKPKLAYTQRFDFLPAGEVADLLRFARENEAAFVPTGIGHGTAQHVDSSVRISVKLEFDKAMKTRLRQRFLDALPAIVAQFKTEAFEPAVVELELVAHGDGAFYARHIDLFPAANLPQLRVISAVYYFHREPKAFNGGALRLHEVGPPGADGFADFEPVHNSCIFFPAWMPHEVLPVSCPSGRFMDSRFAVNCWFRKAV